MALRNLLAQGLLWLVTCLLFVVRRLMPTEVWAPDISVVAEADVPAFLLREGQTAEAPYTPPPTCCYSPNEFEQRVAAVVAHYGITLEQVDHQRVCALSHHHGGTC